MSPSDLPWWGWILFAAGAGLVAKLLFASYETADGREVNPILGRHDHAR